MTLLAPLWLFGLLPWAMLVLWLLSGRWDARPVPFLELWRADQSSLPRNPKRWLVRPPFWLVLMLLAMLVAIVGASQPRITELPYTTGPSITIILDRGMSMTAQSNGQPRWKQIVQALRFPLQSRFGMGDTRLILLPEKKTIDTNRPSWAVYANDADPPAGDTREMLAPVISRELHRTDGLIFVLTDQKLPIEDPRVVPVPPIGGASNVGIVSAGIATSPKRSVLVRVRNDSDRKSAELRVGAGPAQLIELPGKGEKRNYFIDLDQPSKTIAIELSPMDDQPLDNHAELLQRSAWPIPQGQGELSAEVKRMIASYGKVRPATPGISSVVTIAQDPITRGRSIIAPPTTRPIVPASVNITDHPITQHIDWERALRSAKMATAPPGWTAVVTAGDRPIIAIREDPARQVWIGVASPDFAMTTDFVLLWTSALDWAGQGGETYDFIGHPAVPIFNASNTAWVETLRNLPGVLRGGLDVAAHLLLTSVMLAVLSLLLKPM